MPQTQSLRRQLLLRSPCPQAGGEAGPSAASEAAEILPRKTLPEWCGASSILRQERAASPLTLLIWGLCCALRCCQTSLEDPTPACLPSAPCPSQPAPAWGFPQALPRCLLFFWGQTMPVLLCCLSPACRAECQPLPDVKWQI